MQSELIYKPDIISLFLFSVIVVLVLIMSWYFARKARSAAGYYAAGGKIHWMVNGIAFAGDYLSAASFLGICGMISLFGFDGFLYSIGYLAGWIVALFVVAEPLKRIGKYTFTDALDFKFNSRSIQLTAAISTLVVSICYLIPQMVGAGSLIQPLLGLPHYIGVLIVGGVVIIIVSTAGMTSTTYVQFLKGTLLIIFSVVLTLLVLGKGLVTPEFKTLSIDATGSEISDNAYAVRIMHADNKLKKNFFQLENAGTLTWWQQMEPDSRLMEVPFIAVQPDGTIRQRIFATGFLSKIVRNGEVVTNTGPLGPVEFLSTIINSIVVSPVKLTFTQDKIKITLWYHNEVPGSTLMRPGVSPTFKLDRAKGATPVTILNFISLMLALFLGTSALPHILIRYYTVPSPKDARKSTIIAIAAIGFFYILTLFMGLGAMSNTVLDVRDSNMAAPLLAQSFNTIIFSIISALAFATVLGTVSGLIVASSGAIAHDFADRFLGKNLTDKSKVFAGKLAAVGVGIVAIILGILFNGMNVSFLVGWAFSVAASANFPSIIMLLFWKKTTAKGIAASIVMGIVSSLTIILLSPDMFVQYGQAAEAAPIKLGQPAIISVPLSFTVLIIVSLITQKKKAPG